MEGAAAVLGLAAVAWLLTAVTDSAIDPADRPSVFHLIFSLIAVAAAISFAIANVLIRMLSCTEPPNRILFDYHVGGSVIFLGPAVRVLPTPLGMEWIILGLIGILTTVGPME